MQNPEERESFRATRCNNKPTKSKKLVQPWKYWKKKIWLSKAWFRKSTLPFIQFRGSLMELKGIRLFSTTLSIAFNGQLHRLCLAPALMPHAYQRACCCLVAKSCLTYPMDCSPPGSSVHGISQTRILEWVAISEPASPALADVLFTTEPQGSLSEGLSHCKKNRCWENKTCSQYN